MAKTIMQVFDEAVAKWGNRPAMRVKERGAWRTITWSAYRDQARRAARGFMALGLQPKKGVAIIGYNRPEWFISDIGAILAGGVPAGIYTTCSPEQCQYITDHCEAAVAVVENAEQLAKFQQIRDQLPRLKAIVMMEGSDPADDVHTWDELLELGDKVSAEDLQARMDAQQPDDVCTLIYTSGTTGPPKAVMISHHNITWVVRAVIDHEGNFGPDDRVISYLPLSHIAEQAVSLHAPMTFGGCAWFAESIETLGDTLREVRPTLFVGVPRVWEKIQAKIKAAAAGNSGLKKMIGGWARQQGLAGGYAEQQGRARPLLYPLADKLVFSKVREALGLDQCRIPITTAAPITLDTLEFFLSLGVRLCEIYGMSECTGPGTISLPRRYRTGKGGYAVPGAEVRIAEDGEVLVRGPHVFKGYYKDEEATREALDDEGWLHSGDIGELDSDGFLKITDRKKELIVTAGGKNISPQEIEARLKSLPAVGQAVAIGDGRKYMSALLVLDPEQVASEAAKAGVSTRDPVALAESRAFQGYLQKQLDEVNSQVSRVEAIKRFRILPHELTIDGGELTPTMKLKRRVINEKYAAEIESLYA